MSRHKTGRYALRVSGPEVSGPAGKGSRAEAEARVPRPPSGVSLKGPPPRVCNCQGWKAAGATARSVGHMSDCAIFTPSPGNPDLAQAGDPDA